MSVFQTTARSINICSTRWQGMLVVLTVLMYFLKVASAQVSGLDIPDMVAYTGKVFLMSFKSHPKYGSQDVSLQFSASAETYGHRIPQWLLYNSTTRSLSGVPLPEDQGTTLLTITVTCIHKDEHTSSYAPVCHESSDVFQLTVSKFPWENIVGAARVAKASLESSFHGGVDSRSQAKSGDYGCDGLRVLASLVLCTSIEELIPENRLNLMSLLSSFLAVPVTGIILERSSSHLLKAAENGFQVMSAGAGSGDVCYLDQNVEMLWWLACPTVKHLNDFVRVLQHNVDGGRLQKEIQTSIVGWYVASSNSLLTRQNRKRRGTGKRTLQPTHAPSSPHPTVFMAASPVAMTMSTLTATVSYRAVDTHSLPLSPQILQLSSNVHVIDPKNHESSSHQISSVVSSFPSSNIILPSVIVKSAEKQLPNFVSLSSSSSVATVAPSFLVSSAQLHILRSSPEVILSSKIQFVRPHHRIPHSSTTYSNIQPSLEIDTILPFTTTATPELSRNQAHSSSLSTTRSVSSPIDPCSSTFSASNTSIPSSHLKSSSAIQVLDPDFTTDVSIPIIQHIPVFNNKPVFNNIQTTFQHLELTAHYPFTLATIEPHLLLSHRSPSITLTLSPSSVLPMYSTLLTTSREVEVVISRDVNMVASRDVEVVTWRYTDLVTSVDIEVATFRESEMITTINVVTSRDVDVVTSRDVDVVTSRDVDVVTSRDIDVVTSRDVDVVTSRDVDVVTSQDVDVVTSRDVDVVTSRDVQMLVLSSPITPNIIGASKTWLSPSPADATRHFHESAVTHEYSSPLSFGSTRSITVREHIYTDILPHTFSDQHEELGQSASFVLYLDQEHKLSSRLSHTNTTPEDGSIAVSHLFTYSDEIVTTSEIVPSWSSNIVVESVEPTKLESTVVKEIILPRKDVPSKAIIQTTRSPSKAAPSSTTKFPPTSLVLHKTSDRGTTATEAATSTVATTRKTSSIPKLAITYKSTSRSSLSPSLVTPPATKRPRTRTSSSTSTLHTTTTPRRTAARRPTTSRGRTTLRWTPRWDNEESDFDTDEEQLNNRPYVQKSIKVIRADQGRLLEFNIPHDVFYDIEDGDTRHLSLSLELPSNQALPGSFWLFLEPAQQVIKGLPLHEDMDIKNVSVVLVARDGGGLEATDYITLLIHDTPRRSFTHVFKLKFAIDFQQFVRNRRNLTDLLQKIGSFFGDAGAKFMTVLGVRHGSFVLSWTNNTLTQSTCQTDVLKSVFGQMVRRDGTVRPSFSRHVGRHLQLKEVQLEPLGACIIPPATTSTTTTRATTTHLVTEIRGHGFSIWAHVILPVLIAVLVFILIILIIVFCNRRQRHQQAAVSAEKEAISNDCNPFLFPIDFEAGDASPKTRDPHSLPTDQNTRAGSSQVKNNLNRDQERARKSRDNREQHLLNRDSTCTDLERDRDWGRNCHRKHARDSSRASGRPRDHDRMSGVSASSTLSWDRPNNHYLEEEASSRTSTLKSTKSAGSDKRHRRSPPPYWQSQADPPPYRMPPPYIPSTTTQL